jgi:hypothetical protein
MAWFELQTKHANSRVRRNTILGVKYITKIGENSYSTKIVDSTTRILFHYRERARYIERETIYSGPQEHRNTNESTEKALEH